MKRLLLVLALLLVIGVVALGPGLRREVDMGTGYVAKQMCSCVLIGERSLASCRTDMLPTMDQIQVEALPARAGMRAFVPLLAEREARFEPGYGCTLLP